MRIVFTHILILTLTTSCNFNSKPLDLNEIRENVARTAEIENAKTLAWEKLIDSIYQIAEINYLSSIKLVDSLINNDTSLKEHKISELHFIKGDIYYVHDSLKKAIDEFSTAGNAPKYIAARAGAYIKLRQFDNARSDLYNAARINYDYWWSIGNYYEIVENKDSALFYYNLLYLKDTIVYKKCIERIIVLKNPNTKLLNELIYTDRNRSVIIIEAAK